MSHPPHTCRVRAVPRASRHRVARGRPAGRRLCGQAGAAPASSARGARRHRRPTRRADPDGTRRPDARLPGRRDPGARRGLPRCRRVPGRLARAPRAGALPHRPQAARGVAGQRARRTRHGAGAVREDAERREASAAAGGQAGRQRCRNSTTPSPPQEAARAQVEARKADVEQVSLDLGLHQRDLADRRPDRHHAGQGRQPGRARREHAAHDGVAD